MNDRRPTLLAIDDEPGMLALVEQFANGLNFNVVCHTEGSKALAQVAELRPDAVLVDLRMPELDGLDVLRGIRAIDPACAVILMTGACDRRFGDRGGAARRARLPDQAARFRPAARRS